MAVKRLVMAIEASAVWPMKVFLCVFLLFSTAVIGLCECLLDVDKTSVCGLVCHAACIKLTSEM